MHTHSRGLAFLLSLGGLPLACTPKGDTDSDDGGSTSPGTGAAPTTGTTSPTTGNDSTGATTGAPDTSTTGTPPTSETGSESGVIPPEPTDPTCIASAQRFVECNPRYAAYETLYAQQCELYKDYGLRGDGQPCLDALEAYYVCISMAECAAVDSCASEWMASVAACPNLLGGDGET